MKKTLQWSLNRSYRSFLDLTLSSIYEAQTFTTSGLLDISKISNIKWRKLRCKTNNCSISKKKPMQHSCFTTCYLLSIKELDSPLIDEMLKLSLTIYEKWHVGELFFPLICMDSVWSMTEITRFDNLQLLKEKLLKTCMWSKKKRKQSYLQNRSR